MAFTLKMLPFFTFFFFLFIVEFHLQVNSEGFDPAELKMGNVAPTPVAPIKEPDVATGQQNEFWDLLTFSRKDCPSACNYRCNKASRHKMCIRACNTCCQRCNCVPPGTSGNTDVCPCYAKMTTHGGRLKCP